MSKDDIGEKITLILNGWKSGSPDIQETINLAQEVANGLVEDLQNRLGLPINAGPFGPSTTPKDVITGVKDAISTLNTEGRELGMKKNVAIEKSKAAIRVLTSQQALNELSPGEEKIAADVFFQKASVLGKGIDVEKTVDYLVRGAAEGVRRHAAAALQDEGLTTHTVPFTNNRTKPTGPKKG